MVELRQPLSRETFRAVREQPWKMLVPIYMLQFVLPVGSFSSSCLMLSDASVMCLRGSTQLCVDVCICRRLTLAQRLTQTKMKDARFSLGENVELAALHAAACL